MHIGQEALTNTLRVRPRGQFRNPINLQCQGVAFGIAQDDGDGFTIKDGHDGFGLAGMRGRVEEMGGELKDVQHPTQGHEGRRGITLERGIEVMKSNRPDAPEESLHAKRSGAGDARCTNELKLRQR